MTDEPNTRAELERKIRRLVGPIDEFNVNQSNRLKSSGAAVGFLVALVAFAWGRRRGRRGR